MASPEEIASAVAGLRDLADFIEQHPDLPYAYSLRQRWLVCLTIEDDQADAMAQWARTGGTWNKDFGPDYAAVERTFGPIQLHVYAERDAVCTKRVVGTEVVEIPDPNAPKVTVEREIVEWDCKPILAREAVNV